MTRRRVAALVVAALASASVAAATPDRAAAAPTDGTSFVFFEGFAATVDGVFYDTSDPTTHTLVLSGPSPETPRILTLYAPASTGFRVGAWDVDHGAAGVTPRTVRFCPNQESWQRIEILQFETSGAELVRFAARTVALCPTGIHMAAVAYHATVPIDLLTVDGIDRTSASARVGTTARVGVDVTNRGTTALHPSIGFDAPGATSVAGAPGTCAATLAPGASCRLEVVFRPVDTSVVTVRGGVISESTTWAAPTAAMPFPTLTLTGRSPPPPGDAMTPIAPVRLLDTRVGNGAPASPLDQTPLRVQIAGRGGVPADATAVVANLTVTEPTGDGYLTVWPSDEPRPLVSNLNFRSGDTAPNSALLTLGGDGAIAVFNSSGLSHVLIDVVAWLSPFGDLVYDPLPSPYRLTDSRDPNGGFHGSLGPGEERLLRVPTPSDRFDIRGAVVNITATDPTARTHLTVYGKHGSIVRPNASTLNLVPGETRANIAIVGLEGFQELAVYNNSGRTQVVIDILGYLSVAGETSATGRIVPLSPFRTVDTRESNEVFAPAEASGYRFPTSSGIGDLVVRTIIFNATVTEPTRSGFLTLFPGDLDLIPYVSTLNFVEGQTIPNQTWTRLPTEPDNLVGIFNGSSGRTHVVLDVQGIVLG